jgi:hypothetical protein
MTQQTPDPASLLEAARQWVVQNYPNNRTHLVRTLEWIDTLAPAAADAVRLAALTHDMERAFPGPDQPIPTDLNDPEYERLHSERSARIVSNWLRAQRADESVVDDVARLIEAHEIGGWPDADLVQAADSLSFFDTNIDLFLDFIRTGRFSAAVVREKFTRAFERIRPAHARQLAAPLYEHAKARLAVLETDASAATP